MKELIGPGEYKVILGTKSLLLGRRDYELKAKYFSILKCPNRDIFSGIDENDDPVFLEQDSIDPKYPTCEHYIVIPFSTSTPMEPGKVFESGENKAIWLNLLIWLYKEGNFSSYIHDVIGTGISRNVRYWPWMKLERNRNPEIPLGRGGFRLEINETRKLCAYVNKYFTQDWSQIYNLVRRLALYSSREWGPDLVVDLFIILESLFVNGHENVSYQVRLKTAMFLKNSKELMRLNRTPREVYEFVKKAYGARSSIVHGDKKGQKWLREEYSPRGFRRHNVTELEEIVRSCLRITVKRLQEGKSINPNVLDSELFLL